MGTQLLKRELEDKLGRPMSDATWYRIAHNLRELGIYQDDYSSAFELIKVLNSGKTTPKSKISRIPYGFHDVWRRIDEISVKFNDLPRNLTCDEFRRYLENEMKVLPKPRMKNGKVIGLNTIWYTWFEKANCPYEKYKQYNIKQFLSVAAIAYSWEQRKLNLTIKALN